MDIKYVLTVIIFLLFGTLTMGCQAYTSELSGDEIQKTKELLGDAVASARDASLKKNDAIEELIELAKKDNRYLNYFYDYVQNEKSNGDSKGALILVLSRLKDARVPTLLIKMLNDDDVGTRAVVVFYVEEFKIRRALPRLKEMSENDPNEKIRILSKAAYVSIENYNENKKLNYLKIK